MNTAPITTTNNNRGKLTLALCIGGLLLALLIGFTARMLGHDARTFAYLVFVGFQVAALAVGFPARHEPLARAGTIASALLLVFSFLLVA